MANWEQFYILVLVSHKSQFECKQICLFYLVSFITQITLWYHIRKCQNKDLMTKKKKWKWNETKITKSTFARHRVASFKCHRSLEPLELRHTFYPHTITHFPYHFKMSPLLCFVVLVGAGVVTFVTVAPLSCEIHLWIDCATATAPLHCHCHYTATCVR